MTVSRQPVMLVVALGCVVLAGCNLDLSSLGSNANPDPTTTDPPGMDPPPMDDPDSDPPDDPDEIPLNAYCEPVVDWDAAWAALEEDVIELMNMHRAQGADCGSAGTFGATHPLTIDSALHCAARNHSLDMNVRDFFSHTNPDGDGPGERIRQAGYSPLSWGENIARGQATPENVVNAWMDSDGHCANIMRPSFTELGIGFYEGNFWTAAYGDD